MNGTPVSHLLPEDSIPVENLNDFVRLLAGWHANAVAKVNHLQEVPLDSVFQVENDAEIVMTAPVLAGFKLGVELTMAQLGTLPFAVELDDEEQESAQTDAEALVGAAG